MDRINVYRIKSHFQIVELRANQRMTPLADWRMICRSKKYSISRSNKYFWIEELSPDRSLICRMKKHLLCRLKNYLQIKELSRNRRSIWSADRSIVGRLSNHFQMKDLSSDLRITPLVDWRMICRSKKYLIFRSKKCL